MIRKLFVGLLAVVGLSAAQGTQTFNGVITDHFCANGSHAQMRMGPTDAECVRACIISHDAMYVLFDGKNAYTLSDQRHPKSSRPRRCRSSGPWMRRQRRSTWTPSWPRNSVTRSDLSYRVAFKSAYA